MKSSHSKSNNLNLAVQTQRRIVDEISNELLQECKTCTEDTRISKSLRTKLERFAIYNYCYLLLCVINLLVNSFHLFVNISINCIFLLLVLSCILLLFISLRLHTIIHIQWLNFNTIIMDYTYMSLLKTQITKGKNRR